MNEAASAIRDRAVFLGWIAGILIACALVWILTRPLQSRYLLRAVNKVFIATEDSRRLAASLEKPADGPSPPGYWYSMLESADRLFVFGAMWDGILIPCGALVTPEGTVAEIIPLSEHARQVLDALPPGVMKLYIRRIEAVSGGPGGGI